MTWSVPRRQAGESLRSIDFRNERDSLGEVTARVIGSFRHRDNRIWQARIVPLPPDTARSIFPTAAFVLTLSSAGCRDYHFIAESLASAKRTALRFGNVRMADYERLIADATGTSDYPRTDDVGFFCMRVVKETQGIVTMRVNRSSHSQEDVFGLGRIEDGKIIIFPDHYELDIILTGIADSSSQPLVPEDVNSVNGLSPFSARRTSARDLDDAMEDMGISDAVIREVLQRNRNDSVATAMAGLSSGTYTTPTLRARDERVIDLGDDD